MSGSTIGGVVGAVVGFYIGGAQGAQYGWMIGSAVGGYIDPEVIKLPGIGDAQTQTASDGVPIAVVYGTPPPFQGNLIDGDPKARKIKVKTRQGKGGPIVVSEKFLLSSAIGICEGEIEGVAWVVKDGQLVYDVRPGSQVVADSSKFASKATFYLGTEDQLPDPTLEAIHGVGNTPYNRGLAYMVIKDDDRTQTGGAVAQYAFGVVKNGTTSVITTEVNVVNRLSKFKNSHYPRVDYADQYKYQGKWATANGTEVQSSVYDTIQQVQAWCVGLNSTTGAPGTNAYGSPGLYLGYIAYSGGDAGQAGTGAEGPLFLTYDVIQDQMDVTDLESLVLIYQFETVQNQTGLSAVNAVCGLLADDGILHGFANGEIGYCTSGSLPGYLGLAACIGNGNNIYGVYPLCIQVIRQEVIATDPIFGDPCELQMQVSLPDVPSYGVDCDGNITIVPEYVPHLGAFLQLSIEHTMSDGTNTFITQYPVGPVLESTDPDYSNETYWTNAYNNAVAQGDMPAGLFYGVDYPVEVAETISSITSTTTIDSGEISLEEIEEDIAARCNVPSIHLDFTALGPDVVPGYLVAIPASGADCIRPLQQLYFHDMPEYDHKIRAIKRGAASVITLTDNDFVDVDDGDDDIRRQQTEYPKKLRLAYPDPDGNYAITTQTDPRYSPDIKAVGEDTIPTPIPFNRDEAAKRIAVIQKVAWTTQEGSIKRTLPEEFTYLVGSDCFDYNGKRFRIETRNESDGTMAIEAVYDRASAYESVATGAAPLPPETPVSSLRGPTTFAAMNLTSLRSEDNVPGIYVAMGNILDGWLGCQLLLSVDGGVSFNTVLTTNSPATLGHLTADIDAVVDSSGGPIPVKVHGDLESVTDEQLAVRQNAFAIKTNDVWEIGQFKTATDTGVNTYDLDEVTRGELDTIAVPHFEHDRFVLLDSEVHFIPLDVSLSGKTLIFWPVSIGTPAANNVTYSVVFDPPVFVIDGGEVT